MFYSKHFSDLLQTEVSDAHLDIGVKGDMASIGWYESNPEDLEVSLNNDIVQITHAALNFRDVMCASGRLSADALPGGYFPLSVLLCFVSISEFCYF